MQLTALRVGAAAWMFTGFVHDVLEFVLPGDSELNEAMRASVIEVGPVSLDAERLNRGVSLAMGFAMFVVGLLLLMIIQTMKSRPNALRPFGIVMLVATIMALGLSVVLIPGPPVVTFSVATVAFIVAMAVKAETPSLSTSNA
jgi:hypothetical protein